MFRKCCLLFAVCSLLLVGCRFGPANKTETAGAYGQDFKTDVAFLVLEWNGKPYILASGFLADRSKGVFYTAKHFTDEFAKLGTDECKLFFNGKVYTARLVRLPPLRDSAIIKIVSSFSAEELPEPRRLASEMPVMGDQIFVLGFHPHSFRIRTANQSEGFPDREVPLMKDYYKKIIKDPGRQSEVVFDNLEGKRVNPVPLDELLAKEMREYENESYIKLKMVRDHKFSFGGLSGGAAVNSRGEVVGVITAQDPFRFEFDENGFMVEPDGTIIAVIKKQFFDTLYITPIDSLRDLRVYLNKLK